MTAIIFNDTKFDSNSVADQLKKARQRRKTKIEKIAEVLNIQLKFLKALEKGNYKELPAGAYGKKYLSEYAIYLGLNVEEIMNEFENEIKLEQKDTPKLFNRQAVKKMDFWTPHHAIKITSIASIIIVFFLYLFFCFNKLYSSPELSITNPPENFSTNERNLEIKGITDPEVKVFVNNELVLNDSQGNFSKLVSLKSGINMITIEAQKKYGKSQKIVRQILVKEEKAQF